MNPEIIGSVAGILTTISFLPQAIKSLKAKDTKSISLLMYSLFTIGVSLWLFYGVLLDSIPMIVSNGITLVLSVVILAKKIHNLIKKID